MKKRYLFASLLTLILLPLTSCASSPEKMQEAANNINAYYESEIDLSNFSFTVKMIETYNLNKESQYTYTEITSVDVQRQILYTYSDYSNGNKIHYFHGLFNGNYYQCRKDTSTTKTETITESTLNTRISQAKQNYSKFKTLKTCYGLIEYSLLDAKWENYHYNYEYRSKNKNHLYLKFEMTDSLNRLKGDIYPYVEFEFKDNKIIYEKTIQIKKTELRQKEYFISYKPTIPSDKELLGYINEGLK